MAANMAGLAERLGINSMVEKINQKAEIDLDCLEQSSITIK